MMWLRIMFRGFAVHQYVNVTASSATVAATNSATTAATQAASAVTYTDASKDDDVRDDIIQL